MKKNLRSKILLCVLAGGVLAANTAFAAKVYTETISGANDNYGTGVKSSDGATFIYDFGENAELKIDESELTNPMHAAVSSLLAFTGGALIPLVAAIVSPDAVRIYITLAAVGLALTLTGYYSATIGGASRRRAVARVILGGMMAMLITYGIGRLFGTAIS